MIKRMTWFLGGAVAGVAGVGVVKRKMKQAATHLAPKHVVRGMTDRVRDAYAEGRRAMRVIVLKQVRDRADDRRRRRA
jgi:hypothetical protein